MTSTVRHSRITSSQTAAGRQTPALIRFSRGARTSPPCGAPDGKFPPLSPYGGAGILQAAKALFFLRTFPRFKRNVPCVPGSCRDSAALPVTPLCRGPCSSGRQQNDDPAVRHVHGDPFPRTSERGPAGCFFRRGRRYLPGQIVIGSPVHPGKNRFFFSTPLAFSFFDIIFLMFQ